MSERIRSAFEKIPDQFTKFEDGVYNPIDFYTSSGEFNLSLFNKDFREEQLNRLAFYRQKEIERLDELNKTKDPRLELHQYTVGEHLINMKNVLSDLFSDLKNKPISTELLTKDNRLFYIGLFLLLIFVSYLFLKFLLKRDNAD